MRERRRDAALCVTDKNHMEEGPWACLLCRVFCGRIDISIVLTKKRPNFVCNLTVFNFMPVVKNFLAPLFPLKYI